MEVEFIISSRGVGIMEVSGFLCTVLFMHDNVCSFRSYVSREQRHLCSGSIVLRKWDIISIKQNKYHSKQSLHSSI
jgi:hypothetical protein